MSYFDHFAQSPSTPIGNWITGRTKQHEFALMKPLLPDRGCAILEVGPGTGELAAVFLEAGYRNYTVVEPNAMMREHLARKDVITKDYMIPKLAEEDNSYDAIILIDVFEHLDSSREARIFTTEARRVLRPGGILCIASPDYLHWKEDFFNCDFSHSNITSVRRTLQLLHNNGFRTLEYVYFSGFFTGTLATLMSYLARIGLWFANSNGIDKKLYKLKLTFLRRFFIIGAKQA